MTKVRDWLKGKKTYISAGIAVAGALIAFGDHQIDATGLVAAVWAAAQSCFIRAGIGTTRRTSADSTTDNRDVTATGPLSSAPDPSFDRAAGERRRAQSTAT